MIDCSQGNSSSTEGNGHKKTRQKWTKLCGLVAAEMAMSASPDIFIQSCNTNTVFDNLPSSKFDCF